jgi:hypothetical protein
VAQGVGPEFKPAKKKKEKKRMMLLGEATGDVFHRRFSPGKWLHFPCLGDRVGTHSGETEGGFVLSCPCPICRGVKVCMVCEIDFRAHC